MKEKNNKENYFQENHILIFEVQRKNLVVPHLFVVLREPSYKRKATFWEQRTPKQKPWKEFVYGDRFTPEYQVVALLRLDHCLQFRHNGS